MHSVYTRISDDLNINPYKDESEKQFISRLVYSAIGIWARFFAATDEEHECNCIQGNITKNKMHRRIEELISNYISINDYLSEYFYSDDYNPANSIRDTLARSTDIVDAGFDGRMSISNPSLCDF